VGYSNHSRREGIDNKRSMPTEGWMTKEKTFTVGKPMKYCIQLLKVEQEV
jgi:hypothetical protein